MTTDVDIIVTRHPGLVDYLRTEYRIVADRVVSHASADDVYGQVVAGVLPLPLAAKCSEVYLVDLAVPAALQDDELDLADIRALQPQLRRYSVWDLTDDRPEEYKLPVDLDRYGLPDNDLLRTLGFELSWRVGERLRKRHDAGERDFGGAKLNGMDLSGANLNEADLSCANLNGANLEHANLSAAKLNGADLRGACLRAANLRSANLNRARLNGVDLTGADLRNADLGDADLSGAGGLLNFADLRGADFSRTQIAGTGLDVNGMLAKQLEADPALQDRNIGDIDSYTIDEDDIDFVDS